MYNIYRYNQAVYNPYFKKILKFITVYFVRSLTDAIFTTGQIASSFVKRTVEALFRGGSMRGR